MARWYRTKQLCRNECINSFLGPQIGARNSKITRLSQIPNGVIGVMSVMYDWDNLPTQIAELDDMSVDCMFNTTDALNLLKDILGRITSFEARRPSEDAETDDAIMKYAKLLYDLGGVEVLTRVVMYSSLSKANILTDNFEDEHSTKILRVKSICLEILCKVIACNELGEKVARELTDQQDFLSYLFTLLANEKTFLLACQTIEDLLQARRSVLNLNAIPHLKDIITSLSEDALANFCRILAVTISDLDIYENKSSLFAQNKQKRAKGFVNVRDINQELLLSMPEILPRLIKLATARDYTPRYRGMDSELDCWMEWIENSMSDSACDVPTDDDLGEFIGGVSEPTTAGGPMVHQSGLKISTDLILRVQVVYVLGLFLVGKHRKKVQRKLAELLLVPGLSYLFDQFIWKCQVHRNNSRHRLRGHNASCECSPEVALKIQFLRLVHSFCDHSDFKHLLLSKSELNELKRINVKAGPLQIDGLDGINKALMCRGKMGLLSKIVDVMKKEPTASTFRFWLARAVESYLRGSTSYCDQVFLIRRGLLQHIAGNIVDHDIRPKEILQSSFDLLGEVIKFNIDAFKQFDKVLCTKEKFERFVSIVNRNLVDSNMFIRSLVLSLEHFCTAQPEYKEYAERESQLLNYVRQFDVQIDYLKRLIILINVQNLTQENVSCLNTTLVFLMFSKQKNVMPSFLRALMSDKAITNPSGTTCSSPPNLMKNFRDLLIFWQDHYLHKDKDCSALEKSSRISFDYWKQTVNTLVSDDRNADTGIIHYMDPETISRNS